MTFFYPFFFSCYFELYIKLKQSSFVFRSVFMQLLHSATRKHRLFLSEYPVTFAACTSTGATRNVFTISSCIRFTFLSTSYDVKSFWQFEQRPETSIVRAKTFADTSQGIQWVVKVWKKKDLRNPFAELWLTIHFSSWHIDPEEKE